MARAFGIELYEAFVSVAECASFTEAAAQLHRTQATISQQIKRLERSLERPLFVRTSRHVRLAPPGETLLPYARYLLRLHEQAAQAVAGTPQTPLRLGVPDLYADAVLPGFIDVLRNEVNAPAPVVHCDQSVELFDQFSAGKLDIILTARYPNFPAGRTVSTEDLVWVGSTEFHWPSDTPVPVILYPDGCPFRARALAALRYAEIAWEIIYTGQSGAALHAPLLLGLGITVMSRRTIPPELREIGDDLGLPRIHSATLDLHLSVPVVEHYGSEIEESLWRSAATSLEQL